MANVGVLLFGMAPETLSDRTEAHSGPAEGVADRQRSNRLGMSAPSLHVVPALAGSSRIAGRGIITRTGQAAFAAVVLGCLTSCGIFHHFKSPANDWQTRNGQLQYRTGGMAV